MRVLLVVPRMSGGDVAPSLGIITLAAMTPREVEVSVIDENAEPIDFDREFDLVGVSAMTASAIRAYELADAFRKRGRTVVLGGFHPSALPEEAIQHCDSVVIGEADGIWPELLRDFETGRLQRFYRRAEQPKLENLPLPRRDLLRRRAYWMFNTVEAGRGCPFGCKFCSVTKHFGGVYRFRPVADVVRDVATLKGKFMFFVDDNIVGSPKHSKELFRALIPCRKRWIGQASLTLARDEELLDLAARSGCVALFIGFESISEASLKEAGKTVNDVKRYEEEIRRIRGRGIAVHGAFIFGFDSDDEGVFKRTVEFVKQAKLDSVSFATLTPFPGTPLFEKLEREKRIVTYDWSKYGRVVFKPRLMSLERLNEGCNWAWRECYSVRSILGRLATRKRYWPLHVLLNFVYRQARRPTWAG